MMNYDRMIQPDEAVLMGRPPRAPSKVLGLRLPVSIIKALDQELKKNLNKWAANGVRDRTSLIRRYIIEGLERDREPR